MKTLIKKPTPDTFTTSQLVRAIGRRCKRAAVQSVKNAGKDNREDRQFPFVGQRKFERSQSGGQRQNSYDAGCYRPHANAPSFGKRVGHRLQSSFSSGGASLGELKPIKVSPAIVV